MIPTTFSEAVRLFREYHALTDCIQLKPGMEDAVERAETLILRHQPQTLAEAADILAVIIENSEGGAARASLGRVQRFLLAMCRSQAAIAATAEPLRLGAAS